MSPENDGSEVHEESVHQPIDTSPRRINVDGISPATNTTDISIAEEAVTPSPEVAQEAPAPLPSNNDANDAVAPVEPVSEPVVPQAVSKPVAKPSAITTDRIIQGVLLLLVLVLAFVSWSLYSDRQNLKKQTASLNAQVASLNANPQAIIQKQTDELLSKVGQLTTLPAGETPTIALVSDAAAAKKQSAFFVNAENGDKVLMYAKAGKAVLYRPSTDKVILVAPLTFNNAK